MSHADWLVGGDRHTVGAERIYEAAAELISRDGLARRQDVTVSETSSSRVLIGAGLQSGQRVIVSGLDTLRDGQKIEEE